MSRVHPLYIVAIAVVALIVTFINTDRAYDALKEARKAYRDNATLARELSTYKQAFDIKKKNSLVRALRRRFASSLEIKERGKTLRIVAKELEVTKLNELVAKIMRENYPINRFDIKRVGTHKAKIELELRW